MLYWKKEEAFVSEVLKMQERKRPMPVGIEDFRELIKQIYSSNSEDAVSKNSSITDYMVIGSFDDANDQNYKNPDYQSSRMSDFF